MFLLLSRLLNVGPEELYWIKETFKTCLAEEQMKRYFFFWKKDGRPISTSAPSRRLYVEARASLQRLRRQEKNFKFNKHHNNLMIMDNKDRSKMVSPLKRHSAPLSDQTTTVLHTPTGSYYGEDVLEDM